MPCRSYEMPGIYMHTIHCSYERSHNEATWAIIMVFPRIPCQGILSETQYFRRGQSRMTITAVRRLYFRISFAHDQSEFSLATEGLANVRLGRHLGNPKARIELCQLHSHHLHHHTADQAPVALVLKGQQLGVKKCPKETLLRALELTRIVLTIICSGK